MRRLPLALFLSASTLALPAFAATPSELLDANKAATAGKAWDSKQALKLEYGYSGQGLTGKTSTLEDLRGGAFVDVYDIPPNSGAEGLSDGRVWERETSGTITDQGGGDVVPLAITESYVDRNLWWHADRGGAQIESLGQKTDGGTVYDVLKVTPKNGTAIEAWFDPKTRLLARTREVQGTVTITTFFSDYAPVDGVQIARKQVVDDGSGANNRQTYTLTHAAFLPAQPGSAFAKPKQHLADYSIAGGAHETTVPFRLLNNHIYAEVKVNGKGPFVFLFDTGGHSIISPTTAKALGIRPKGTLSMTGGGDAVVTSGAATVQSLQVGGASMTNQPVTVFDFTSKQVEGIDEEGMIGYEFFDRFVTRIDYGKHTLTFIDKRHFDPKDAGTPVPIRFYHQWPEVLGSYDGIPGRFGIDTGARTPLELSGPFAAKHDIRARVKGGAEAMSGWGVGGPTRSFVFRGGTLKLGEVVIERPLTMFSLDKGGAGAAEAFPNNVGAGILKRFVVTLDYDHNTIYFKPIAGSIPDLDTFDRSGMWINAAKDGLKVIDVTKGGPADQAGVVKDDIITSVDGKPASSVKLYDLRERLRTDPPGTVVTFTVKHGGASWDVKVTLRDLI